MNTVIVINLIGMRLSDVPDEYLKMVQHVEALETTTRGLILGRRYILDEYSFLAVSSTKVLLPYEWNDRIPQLMHNRHSFKVVSIQN